MKIASIILWSITCFMLLTGFLFRGMHWPGASLMTVLGFTLAPLSMLIYFIGRIINKAKMRIPTYGVYMYFLVMFLGLTMYWGSTISKDLLNGMIDIQHQLENNNQNLVTISQESEFLAFKEVKDQTSLVIEQINRDKQYLIEMTSGVDENGYPLGKDNQDFAAQYYLVDYNGENGQRLKVMIEQLNQLYQNLGPNLNFKLVKTDPFISTRNGIITNWIPHTVEHATLAEVLLKLSSIQNNILSNEIMLLNHLKKHAHID